MSDLINNQLENQSSYNTKNYLNNQKMMRATLILMVLTANILSTVQSMQSYVYLNEKSIREELPVNSFVVNLKSEISAQNVFKRKTLQNTRVHR